MDLNLSFNQDSISYDWFLLILRLVFIGLVYLFIYQVARVTVRELVQIGTAQTSRSAPTAQPVAAQLEVLDPAESGLHRGEILPLDPYTTIGRRDGNAIVLPDSFVSSQHAEIVYDNGAWWIDDLGSTNGTLVNNRPVSTRIRIAPGDVIQFGRVSTRLTQ